jgi:4-hydroxy-tetrahydrodipicolinate synthase
MVFEQNFILNGSQLIVIQDMLVSKFSPQGEAMFTGCITALATPMFANGDIDFESLKNLVDRQLAAGIHGLVVNGTTGEACTLSKEEQQKTLATVIERVNKRVPVIAGTGNYSTKQTIENTKAAMQLGADGCLVVTPYYNKPTQQGLFEHYKAIAEAVPIPIIVYNIPTRTCCDMKPETLMRLSHIPNIVALKQGNLTMPQAQAFIDQCGERLDLLTGNDDEALPVMLIGFKGVISVVSNIAPKMMRQMCDAVLAGEVKTAREINRRLLPLQNKLFIETNPIPVKWALHKMGLIPEGLRLPLTPLAEKFRAEVEQCITGVE